MISARMRPHTVTVYVYAGETAGKPTYTRTVLAGVAFEKDYGLVMERRGIAVKDTAQVIIDLRATPLTLSFPVNSFFVAGDCSDTIPAKTKQTIAAERTVYNITRAYLPPNGCVIPTILELYAR